MWNVVISRTLIYQRYCLTYRRSLIKQATYINYCYVTSFRDFMDLWNRMMMDSKSDYNESIVCKNIFLYYFNHDCSCSWKNVYPNLNSSYFFCLRIGKCAVQIDSVQEKSVFSVLIDFRRMMSSEKLLIIEFCIFWEKSWIKWPLFSI